MAHAQPAILRIWQEAHQSGDADYKVQNVFYGIPRLSEIPNRLFYQITSFKMADEISRKSDSI